MIPVVAMPVPSGFVSTSRSPGARLGVGEHLLRRDQSGDGESVDRLRVANGVSADDGAADFARFLDAAAENRCAIVLVETNR